MSTDLKTIWQCLIFCEDNLPVLHFSLFFSIFCEDNCTTATYFVKTIVLVLMKTILPLKTIVQSPCLSSQTVRISIFSYFLVASEDRELKTGICKSLIRKPSYSLFFLAGCTDFKNVIFEKNH